MKIAVALKDGKISQIFGNTQKFLVYTAENDKIVSEDIIKVQGGQETFAGLLVFNDVNVLICGGIEGEPLYSLLTVGIRTYPGIAGEPRDAALQFLSGDMKFTPDKGCEHEHHHHHEECKTDYCNGDCSNCKL